MPTSTPLFHCLCQTKQVLSLAWPIPRGRGACLSASTETKVFLPCFFRSNSNAASLITIHSLNTDWVFIVFQALNKRSLLT
ncbi:rCG59540, partial [Rattus norvegicus]